MAPTIKSAVITPLAVGLLGLILWLAFRSWPLVLVILSNQLLVLLLLVLYGVLFYPELFAKLTGSDVLSHWLGIKFRGGVNP